MVLESTPVDAARLAGESPLLTTTTTPGTGGSLRVCPALSGRGKPGFDQVMSLEGRLKARAIDSSVSPCPTVYRIGLRSGRGDVGMDTGLMIVLLRPNEMSPTEPPSVAAAALTEPGRGLRDWAKLRSIAPY